MLQSLVFIILLMIYPLFLELQSTVDRLLGEKVQLCEQIEVLKKEKEELKEQVQKCAKRWDIRCTGILLSLRK